MVVRQRAPLLSIRDLRVTFPTRQGEFQAVRGVSFDLGRERLGVVGESGSGKSMTGRAILGLIRPPGRVTAQALTLGGQDILNLSERQRRAIRGRRIGPGGATQQVNWPAGQATLAWPAAMSAAT